MKTTVEISVGEYEALKALATAVQGMQASLDAANSRIAQLTEQVELFRRMMFGQKSERITDMPGNIDLLPGFDLPEQSAANPDTIEVPKHERKRTKRKSGDFQLELPDNLERVEEPIEPPEAERTLPDGRKLVRIGEERVEKLAHRQVEYYVKVFVKGIWALPGDTSITPIQEAMPDDLAHGSKLDVSFYAHLAVEKFCYHMPLYRTQEKLAGREIQVSRQLLSQALNRAGDAVLPLVNLMEKEILRHDVIFTDETPVKLQDKKKCKEAYIWIYTGGKPPDESKDPPYIIYKFEKNRSYDHPLAFLKTFSGLLHADAFGAYEKLDADPERDIKWSACFAHARRKHFEAQTHTPDFRQWILRHIRYLYLFERIAWTCDADERLRIRDKYERPVIDKIFAGLKEEACRKDLLPGSKAAKAINYMLTRETNFRYYLDHAEARIDNNISERGIRKLTIGRKNWMFIGSEAAGEKQMALLSLIQTCRHLDIKPQEYLEDIFSRILTHPASRLNELLPDQWKADRAKPSSQEQ